MKSHIAHIVLSNASDLIIQKEKVAGIISIGKVKIHPKRQKTTNPKMLGTETATPDRIHETIIIAEPASTFGIPKPRSNFLKADINKLLIGFVIITSNDAVLMYSGIATILGYKTASIIPVIHVYDPMNISIWHGSSPLIDNPDENSTTMYNDFANT